MGIRRAITKVIFDNDGVNVDSEDVAMRVMDDWGVELVRRYLPDADLPQDFIYKTYPGTSTDKIVEALIKKFDLPLPLIRQDYDLADNAADGDVPALLALAVTAETIKRFQAELKAIPGVTKAHEQLREKYGAENIALCTTSPEDRMHISLECAVDPVTGENARLAEFFPKGENRRSGYGHPNKYDEGFAALGWDPEETVVIEDSISGVTKAKAGREKMHVIGTVAAKFYEDKDAQAEALLKAGAIIVVSDFADLPKALEWLDNGMNFKDRPEFAGKVYVPSITYVPTPAVSPKLALN